MKVSETDVELVKSERPALELEVEVTEMESFWRPVLYGYWRHRTDRELSLKELVFQGKTSRKNVIHRKRFAIEHAVDFILILYYI